MLGINREEFILDKQTKILIESQIDGSFNEPILPEIEWASKQVSLSSMRDFALGYLISMTGALGMSIAAARSKPDDDFEETNKIIQDIVKKRIPKIIEKIDRELNL